MVQYLDSSLVLIFIWLGIDFQSFMYKTNHQDCFKQQINIHTIQKYVIRKGRDVFFFQFQVRSTIEFALTHISSKISEQPKIIF